MFVNKNKDTTEHVKFISYTGKYPNLCSGVLTLAIDGIEYSFGHDYANYDYGTHSYNDNNFDDFWTTGEDCGFTDDWDDYCHEREWKINVHELPEQFRQYAAEIDEVFNDNVEYGCCGGCL